MEKCIFCSIVKGEVDSAKIWEDDSFMAILDNKPNTKCMTLVIPKKHYHSYIFDMEDSDYCKLMMAARKVSKILEKKIKVKRVAMVLEGMGINHAHVKLYPLHGLDKKFKETWSSKKIFFEKYEGYISTQLGPNADMKELKAIAKKIKS